MFNYGEEIDFRKNKVMEFPDFILEYLGERFGEPTQWVTPEYPKGGTPFVYFDFKATSGNQSIYISDTHGTGNITDKNFKLGDNYFNFENKNGVTIKKITVEDFYQEKLSFKKSLLESLPLVIKSIEDKLKQSKTS